MPTVFSHAIAATALGQFHPRRVSATGFRAWTIFCSVLPDADVIGFPLGIRYDDMLGHRGLSHSLCVAALTGIIVARLSAGPSPRRASLAPLALYFALVTASHGLLDALTDGGRGIAFLAPFDRTRYFFPWRPIEVSPIGASFFSRRGMDVILSEMRWIWLPAVLLTVGRQLYRPRPAA